MLNTFTMIGDDATVVIFKLKLPTLGLGYNCASNADEDFTSVCVIGFSLVVVILQPVLVSVCDFVEPKVPQEVCPRTINTPPVKPVLKRSVMLELSAVADTMLVLAGRVQRNTVAVACDVVGAGTMAV